MPHPNNVNNPNNREIEQKSDSENTNFSSQPQNQPSQQQSRFRQFAQRPGNLSFAAGLPRRSQEIISQIISPHHFDPPNTPHPNKGRG